MLATEKKKDAVELKEKFVITQYCPVGALRYSVVRNVMHFQNMNSVDLYP